MGGRFLPGMQSSAQLAVPTQPAGQGREVVPWP